MPDTAITAFTCNNTFALHISQFSSVAQLSDGLRPHGLQHSRLSCLSLSPGVCSSPVHFSHPVLSDSTTPWTAACQASLPFTISWSCLKFMSIESVIPSNHVILCHPLFLLPSIFPSIRVFSNESVLCIR